jgi:hypothetical protein
VAPNWRGRKIPGASTGQQAAIFATSQLEERVVRYYRSTYAGYNFRLETSYTATSSMTVTHRELDGSHPYPGGEATIVIWIEPDSAHLPEYYNLKPKSAPADTRSFVTVLIMGADHRN